jgi:hypothetical protein
MPNTLPNVIGPRPCTSFRNTFASQFNPCILLEIPHALGEQARSNQVQEARRDHKKDLQRCLVAAFVDEIAN